jgi:hypothetical protein
MVPHAMTAEMVDSVFDHALGDVPSLFDVLGRYEMVTL